MLFIAHALDKPGALPRRMAVIADHRAYLDQAPGRLGVSVLMSGPLTEDDGEAMKGSFFLIDAPSRSAVEGMFASDPMGQADVWAALTITRVAIRQNKVGPVEGGA